MAVACGQRQSTTTCGGSGVVGEIGVLGGLARGDDGLVEIDGLERSEFDRRTSSKGKLGKCVESGVLLDDDVSKGEEQMMDSMSAIALSLCCRCVVVVLPQ